MLDLYANTTRVKQQLNNQRIEDAKKYCAGVDIQSLEAQFIQLMPSVTGNKGQTRKAFEQLASTDPAAAKQALSIANQISDYYKQYDIAQGGNATWSSLRGYFGNGATVRPVRTSADAIAENGFLKSAYTEEKIDKQLFNNAKKTADSINSGYKSKADGTKHVGISTALNSNNGQTVYVALKDIYDAVTPIIRAYESVADTPENENYLRQYEQYIDAYAAQFQKLTQHALSLYNTQPHEYLEFLKAFASSPITQDQETLKGLADYISQLENSPAVLSSKTNEFAQGANNVMNNSNLFHTRENGGVNK